MTTTRCFKSGLGPLHALFPVLLALPLLRCDAQPVTEESIGVAGDASIASPACASLASCCPALPSDVQTSCKALAVQAGAAECSAELAALASAGRCRSAADAGAVDADVHSDGSPDGSLSSDGSAGEGGVAVACTLLQACCASAALPAGETATCMSIQGSGDEKTCAGLLTDLTSASECQGASAGGGGCPELQQCCASSSFPSTFANACLAAVSSGEDASCSSMLATYLSAGYCGAAVHLTDGGHPQDPACSMLAMCCAEETFPTGTLSTCQQIVSGNEGGNCASAYDGYVALNYCE
jgi:hypothetical protein